MRNNMFDKGSNIPHNTYALMSLYTDFSQQRQKETRERMARVS